MIRRLLSVWHARNLEFLRDRGTLMFTLVLPVAIVIGMGFVFGGPERPVFKVGVLAPTVQVQSSSFLSERFVDFVPLPDRAEAISKVARHQIDLLFDPQPPHEYWVDSDSPKGYIIEKLLLERVPDA